MGSKGLTKEIIVQEAVALIEESGQWVISLHELARRLQVKTPSLYNHIANPPVCGKPEGRHRRERKG